ncbi:hypothetical protein C8R43DRAFT_960301 [Mycena crocata]|nr:hypothetical protein C8R43DRAFT_960301 [Mycena crocata]
MSTHSITIAYLFDPDAAAQAWLEHNRCHVRFLKRYPYSAILGVAFLRQYQNDRRILAAHVDRLARMSTFTRLPSLSPSYSPPTVAELMNNDFVGAWGPQLLAAAVHRRAAALRREAHNNQTPPLGRVPSLGAWGSSAGTPAVAPNWGGWGDDAWGVPGWGWGAGSVRRQTQASLPFPGRRSMGRTFKKTAFDKRGPTTGQLMRMMHHCILRLHAGKPLPTFRRISRRQIHRERAAAACRRSDRLNRRSRRVF